MWYILYCFSSHHHLDSRTFCSLVKKSLLSVYFFHSPFQGFKCVLNMLCRVLVISQRRIFISTKLSLTVSLSTMLVLVLDQYWPLYQCFERRNNTLWSIHIQFFWFEKQLMLSIKCKVGHSILLSYILLKYSIQFSFYEAICVSLYVLLSAPKAYRRSALLWEVASHSIPSWNWRIIDECVRYFNCKKVQQI